MKKEYFNYNSLLEDFLNEPLIEQVKNTKILIGDKEIQQSFRNKFMPKSEYQEISDLMSCDRYIDERKSEESYIFGVINDELKIVQYSKNYLLDDLLTIQEFLKSCNLDEFKNKLNKVYFINQKIKNKYIKKANKKNKETLYGNYNVGANILNYIYDKDKYDLMGERYGIENHVESDLALEDPEITKHKTIIIINFDNETVELYDSIAYDLVQKGSEALENDSIYGSYFADFNHQVFFDKLNEQ